MAGFDKDQFMRSLQKQISTVKKAAADALNQAAKQVQTELREEMQKQFDRPTPFTLNSIYIKRANKDNLTAVVGIKDIVGGKASYTAADVLKPEFAGGTRIWKRLEGGLRRVGVLPNGLSVVPGAAAELDAYGNIKRSQSIQILSYFQAFGEQGYRANSTDRSRKRLAKLGKTESGYKTIRGKVYFASRGRGTLIQYTSSTGKRVQRVQHLPAGIWQKSGIHGVDVKPVLLFVRRPSYAKRIDLRAIGDRVVKSSLQSMFNEHLRKLSAR